MTDFEKNLLIIEAYAQEYLQDLDISQIEPAEVQNIDCSLTIPDLHADAFTLNPPIVGNLKVIPPGKTHNGVAVTVDIIGYGLVNKLANNKGMFNFQFSLALNTMLATLKRNIGELKNRKISVKRPSGKVFAQLENSAAIELRIYVSKKEDETERSKAV